MNRNSDNRSNGVGWFVALVPIRIIAGTQECDPNNGIWKMFDRVMNGMKLFSIIAAILFLASCTQIIVQDGSYGRSGNERVNILILGEDFNLASLPRNHQAFERVTNAIATEMQSYGFTVYDETALTLGRFKKSHRRRADDEVIEIARSVDVSNVSAYGTN